MEAHNQKISFPTPNRNNKSPIAIISEQSAETGKTKIIQTTLQPPNPYNPPLRIIGPSMEGLFEPV